MKRKTFQAAKETIGWLIEHKLDSRAVRNHGLPPEDQEEFYQALRWLMSHLEYLTLETVLEEWGDFHDEIEE